MNHWVGDSVEGPQGEGGGVGNLAEESDKNNTWGGIASCR